MTADNKRQESDARMLYPPPEVMESSGVIEDRIVPKGAKFKLLERVEYPPAGGILVHYKGMLQPAKGFPYPEAVWAVDVVKRVVRAALISLSGPEALPSLAVFALLPFRLKARALDRALTGFERVADWMLHSHFIVEQRQTMTARLVTRASSAFLASLGMSRHVVTNVSRVAGAIVEYDDAYRFRIADLASSADEAALQKAPRREALRLLALFAERDRTHAKGVSRAIGRLASLALLHPRVRRAWRTAAATVSMSEMGLDNADRYHALLRDDYDFLGRTFDERRRIFEELHTFSKCCGGDVKIFTEDNAEVNKCVSCGRPCETELRLPPEVEVAGH